MSKKSKVKVSAVEYPTTDFLSPGKIRYGSIENWASTTTHAKRPQVPGRHFDPFRPITKLPVPRAKVEPVDYSNVGFVSPHVTASINRQDGSRIDRSLSVSDAMNVALFPGMRLEIDNNLHDATVDYMISH